MKRAVPLLAILMCTAACERDGTAQSRKQFDRMIRTVQEAPSNLPGVSTQNALDVVVASLNNEGFAVQPEGWTCTYSDRKYFIWYNLKINRSPVKFHWVVAGPDSVIPGNDLARTITRKSNEPYGREK